MKESDEENILPETEESNKKNILPQIEALIFASPNPISLEEIENLLKDENLKTKQIKDSLKTLVERYQHSDFGFSLEVSASKEYQFRTKREFSPLMEKLFETKSKSLSRAAQETLAIIAYRQPVTRADIEFIRGVDAGSIIKNLLERDLLKCVGRKEEVGRPMLFGTTEHFLRVFQISKLSDLPPLESFQPAQDLVSKALEKIAGNPAENSVE